MAVSDIITSQQAYATSAVTSADVFLSSLGGLANLGGITITGLPSPDYVTRDSSDFAKSLFLAMQPVSPTFNDITGVLPEYESTVTIEELPEVTVPDFTGSAPTLDIPQSPDATLPTAPAAPSISDPVLPTAPTVDLPTVPTVADITVPEVPSIEIPVFDSLEPEDDLVAPTTEFSWYEQAYETELLTELKAKLLSDMQNGTYGLETGDEDALWNRARDREMEAAKLEIESAFKQGAARGFPLPPGDMNVALQQAQQNIINKYSSINRDIMIKRNDQYFEARKFTIQEARQLESVLIGFHSSIMERSLNAAKASLESGIAVFNATVAQYNARMDAYRTNATVFAEKIRAAISRIEIYRTEVEGKKLEADLQRQKVEVYRAQLEGINSVVDIYKTQLEAAGIQARIEGTRIEAFRALIEGYRSEIQAKVAEFNMYDSRIKGETSKVDIYRTEAAAYGEVVAGKKVQSDILVARLRGQLEQANQEVEVYKAELDGYRADLAGQTATVQALVNRYGADISGYSAAVGALGQAYARDIQAIEADDRNRMANKEIALENARLAFEAVKVTLDTNLGAGQAASGFYAALAAGAVNSINALSSLAE
jgi:hypothetical protein